MSLCLHECFTFAKIMLGLPNNGQIKEQEAHRHAHRERKITEKRPMRAPQQTAAFGRNAE